MSVPKLFPNFLCGQAGGVVRETLDFQMAQPLDREGPYERLGNVSARAS